MAGTVKDLTNAVAEQFKLPEFNQEAVEAVKKRLLGAEIERRAKMLAEGLDRFKQAEASLKKIRPDQMTYNNEGQEVSATFSKSRVEELKKARESAERWEKAINNALEHADYQKLEEALKQPAKPSKVEEAEG